MLLLGLLSGFIALALVIWVGFDSDDVWGWLAMLGAGTAVLLLGVAFANAGFDHGGADVFMFLGSLLALGGLAGVSSSLLSSDVT